MCNTSEIANSLQKLLKLTQKERHNFLIDLTLSVVGAINDPELYITQNQKDYTKNFIWKVGNLFAFLNDPWRFFDNENLADFVSILEGGKEYNFIFKYFYYNDSLMERYQCHLVFDILFEIIELFDVVHDYVLVFGVKTQELHNLFNKITKER